MQTARPNIPSGYFEKADIDIYIAAVCKFFSHPAPSRFAAPTANWAAGLPASAAFFAAPERKERRISWISQIWSILP